MAKNTTMNIRIDEDTRKELKDFAAEIGMPATSLINACIKQMLRTREVTFNATLRPTPYLKQQIADAEAEADYSTNSSIVVADTDEETIAHLRSM